MSVIGVHSLNDILLRCIVDEETGCWLWQGTRAGGCSPSMWYPPMGKAVAGGVVLYHLLHGEVLRKGNYFHRTCQSGECMNPAHRRVGTRSSQMKNAQLTRSVQERAAIARTRRASSRVLTDEIVADIRSSDETLEQVSKRLGIHLSTASRIRRGEMWVDFKRGASVFNLGATL